ncbi:hypothetical protein G6F56_001598 [Rhizopus delemar]|nr:hypothetical protein G6F56_001598 [Rhizopus delemar]
MSLVHYSSDSEEEEQLPQKRSLSSLLPEPKKVVYVDLPKIEKEEDEEEQRIKRPKTSLGLSLADLLPAPKNTNPFQSKESPAASLAKKIKEKKEVEIQKEKVVEGATAEEEEEGEEEKVEEELPKTHMGSFFRIGKELKEEPVALPSKPKFIQPTTTGLVHTVEKPKEIVAPTIDYDYDPNAMYSTDPSAYQYYQQSQEYPQTENNELDDLQHIVGHRMRGEHNIQITTVNQSDMLPTAEERATQLLTQEPVFDEGPGLSASKLQLKNNNIMALAAHAVNNKAKLDNMFAEQKKTRRDAAKKYGF